MSNLIVVEQLPIITTKIKEIERQLKEKVAAADALAVTAENKQTAKKIKAELNKEFESLEAARKEVKAAVLEPYNEFERIYKDVVANNYKAAEATLKGKIDRIESAEIQGKIEEAREYFCEYINALGIDFISKNWNFADLGLKIKLNTSLTSIKKQIAETLDAVEADYNAIMAMENSAEILVEYAACRDLSTAITVSIENKKAIEMLKSVIEDVPQESEPELVQEDEEILQPPEIEKNEKLYSLTFTVKGTKQMLVDLKNFLNERGYDYE